MPGNGMNGFFWTQSADLMRSERIVASHTGKNDDSLKASWLVSAHLSGLYSTCLSYLAACGPIATVSFKEIEVLAQG